MDQLSKQAINSIITRFSDRSLPKNEWNHQSHLIVGIWHVMNYDFETALDLMKSRISAYNISVGTINADNSGYHETLTVFWMNLIKSFSDEHPLTSIEELCHQFFLSEYASKDYPYNYYSKNVLARKEARTSWVNGDIRKIPFLLRF